MAKTLADLYRETPDFLEGKSIQQIISMADSGKLGDESETSTQLREFLSYSSRKMLAEYSNYCLTDSFENSGFALQDIINEVGRRLGFIVSNGRYRGRRGKNGYDGLWQTKDEKTLIVEVKTTDGYRVNLDDIAKYRDQLDENGEVSHTNSAILLVVGRSDTGELEAQIRGSRHAWDMRLISIDALLRLLELKEELEDENVLNRIHSTLFPQEFTKLDGIVDLVFATAEDKSIIEEDEEDLSELQKKRNPSVNFHTECIRRVEVSKQIKLIKESRTSYRTPDNKTHVVCSVSKYHERHKRFWFAIQPSHVEKLKSVEDSYYCFGCKDEQFTFLIPFKVIFTNLKHMRTTTPKDGREKYWHLEIFPKPSWQIRTSKSGKNLDIKEFKL